MRQANVERRVRWTTPRGAVAELRYADNHLTCWVGATCVSSPQVETHPTAGLCLHRNTFWVPITAEIAAEVASIVAEYEAAEAAHDAEMSAHYAAKVKNQPPDLTARETRMLTA